MTDTATPAITRTVDARGSFCPGPLMELIRAIREGQVGDVIAVYSSDKGSQDRHPEVDREGRPSAGRRSRPATATTRSSSRRRGRPPCSGSSSWAAVSGAPSPPTSWSRSSAARSKAGEVDDHRRRRDRPARLPAGLHVHRDGRRARRAGSSARSAACSTRGSTSSSARSTGSTSRRRPSTSTDGAALGYDHLVLATGSRIVPEAIEHFDTEAHHFYTAEAAARAAHGARRASRAAGSSSASPACPTSARRRRSRSPFLIESELRERGLRETSEIHFCSPIGRAFTIESVSRHGDADPRGEGDRAAHVLQRRGDRPRAQGRP